MWPSQDFDFMIVFHTVTGAYESWVLTLTGMDSCVHHRIHRLFVSKDVVMGSARTCPLVSGHIVPLTWGQTSAKATRPGKLPGNWAPCAPCFPLHSPEQRWSSCRPWRRNPRTTLPEEPPPLRQRQDVMTVRHGSGWRLSPCSPSTRPSPVT